MKKTSHVGESVTSAALRLSPRQLQNLLTQMPLKNFAIALNQKHYLLLARSGLKPLESRRKFIRAVMAYKIVHLSLPPHLVPLAQQWLASHKNGQRIALRNKLSIRLPRPKTDYLKRSPFYASLSEWNKLAQYLKCSMSLSLFRKSLASSAD